MATNFSSQQCRSEKGAKEDDAMSAEDFYAFLKKATDDIHNLNVVDWLWDFTLSPGHMVSELASSVMV